MSIEIQRLDDAVTARWDDYVSRAPGATFFHRAGWRTVMEQAFGHRPHFLYAERDGALVGVLPLVEVKSLFFGHRLSSSPFLAYGGIVAETTEAAERLRQAACDLADNLGVGALEMRNVEASGCGWPVKDLYFTFRKEIDPDDEVNLKAIPNRQRAMIRKGIKAGLESEWDADVDRFYRVYSESVRNLGTPVFSKRYMRILREVFGEDCSVLMITHQGVDVSAVMSFYFRDEVNAYYGGSTAHARTIKGVDHFKYWELMRLSNEQGYRLFDFGRSKAGTGNYSFKKNYGFEPQALPYEYYLVKSDELPDVNPLNPKYQMMINLWKRLPLPVANTLGPFLVQSLG